MPFCFWPGFGTDTWGTAWPFIMLWFSFKVVMWAAIVTTLIYGVRWLRGQTAAGKTQTPLDILRARYARGELNRQDFESMRRDLEA